MAWPSLEQLCEELEAPIPSPAGASAAAAAAALAASLVVMVGRGSGRWADGAATATAAAELRERLVVLGQADVEAVSGLIDAVGTAARAGPEPSDATAVASRAWLRAAQVPLEIAELAAEVAWLAAQASVHGKPPMRPDAAAARALAATAAETASSIVIGNLSAPGSPPRGESAPLVAAARRAAGRAAQAQAPADRADVTAAETDGEHGQPQEGRRSSGAVDLLAHEGRGPLWGAETEDLNLTLLAWPSGQGPGEHVNAERDVVLVVVDGTATAVVDGQTHEVRAGHAVVLPRGTLRAVTAGPGGVRYVSVHRRRGGLQIGRADARPAAARTRTDGPDVVGREGPAAPPGSASLPGS